MSELRDFLENQEIGYVESDSTIHILGSALEWATAVAEGLHVTRPVLVGVTAEGAIVAGEGAVAAEFATLGGLALAYTGPLLGLAGTFMALGSGYEEARAAIHNEATASGFSQGFVAGILNMSPSTVRRIFGRHGVIHRNPMDEEADIIEMKAYNRGLVAGYTLANTATDEQKKSFVFEIREYTGHVDAGAWGDLEKRDYVIEYAAKLRLHFLNEME